MIEVISVERFHECNAKILQEQCFESFLLFTQIEHEYSNMRKKHDSSQ